MNEKRKAGLAALIVSASLLAVVLSIPYFNVRAGYEPAFQELIPDWMTAGVTVRFADYPIVPKFAESIVTGDSESFLMGVYMQRFNVVKVSLQTPEGEPRNDFIIFFTELHELGHHHYYANFTAERSKDFCSEVDYEGLMRQHDLIGQDEKVSCSEGYADLFALYHYRTLRGEYGWLTELKPWMS